MKLFSLVAACALVLSGCATAYQSTGFTGGFSETRLAPDIFRVRFAGNGFTSTERAEDFVILRAADLSAGAGYPYFSIITSATGASQTSIQTPGESVSTFRARGGNFVGATTYVPGQNINIFKPHSGLMIKCFKSKPTGIDTFEAKFIQNEIKRKYQLNS